MHFLTDTHLSIRPPSDQLTHTIRIDVKSVNAHGVVFGLKENSRN